MTIDIDVETLIANHLDGEVLDGVTLTLDSNLFAGPLRPAGTQDDEGATLVSVYVHRRGGAGSDRVDWFSGQGGSDVTTTVAVIVRGDPGEYDEHEALCRAVVEYLHLNPPAATSIIDVISTTPYTPAQRSDTGSGVAPLTELLFSVRYITDGSASSIPSPNAPAGGDLDGEYLNPDVVAVHAGGSSGTRLIIGAISDGQYVARSGTSLIGVAVPVPASRLISTTAPLQGGGDLSADRTLSLADSGASAGSYGSSSAIPVLTVSAKGLITSISTAAINTTSLGAVPTTRTLTGTAPITVGGVSGTPQDLSADRTIAHANSGVTAGQNPPIISAYKKGLTTANAAGHVTSMTSVDVFLDVRFAKTGEFSNTNQFTNTSFSTLAQEAGTSAGVFPIVRVGVGSPNTQGVHRWCATSGSDMPIFFSGVYGVITRQVVRLSALPSSGTTINCFGLINTVSTGALPNDGVYWAYDTSRSPNWLCVTASGGVRTITTTNIPVTDGGWVDLRTKTDRSRTASEFYMGETLIATHTTNIPTALTGLTITVTAHRTEAVAARDLVGISLYWGATYDYVTS